MSDQKQASLSHLIAVHVRLMTDSPNAICTTVKPVLNCHSKIDKKKVLKTNRSLMKVESIAECSLGYF